MSAYTNKYYDRYLFYKKKYLIEKQKNLLQHGSGDSIMEYSDFNLSDNHLMAYSLLDSYLNPNYGSCFEKNLCLLKQVFDGEKDKDLKDIAKDIKENVHKDLDALGLYDYINNKTTINDKDEYIDIKEKINIYFKDTIEQGHFLLEKTPFILHVPVHKHSMCILFDKTKYTIINSGGGIDTYHTKLGRTNDYNLWETKNVPIEISLSYFIFYLLGSISDNGLDMLIAIDDTRDDRMSHVDTELKKLCYFLYKNIKKYGNYHLIRNIIKPLENIQGIKRRKGDLLMIVQLQYIYHDIIDYLNVDVDRKIFSKENKVEFLAQQKHVLTQSEDLFKKYPFIDIFKNRKFTVRYNIMYTEPQKSGSCAFFSLLWSFFYYLLFFKPTVVVTFFETLAKQFTANIRTIQNKCIRKFNIVDYMILEILKNNLKTESQHMHKDLFSTIYLKRELEHKNSSMLYSFEFGKPIDSMSKNNYVYNSFSVFSLVNRHTMIEPTAGTGYQFEKDLFDYYRNTLFHVNDFIMYTNIMDLVKFDNTLRTNFINMCKLNEFVFKNQLSEQDSSDGNTLSGKIHKGYSIRFEIEKIWFTARYINNNDEKNTVNVFHNKENKLWNIYKEFTKNISIVIYYLDQKYNLKYFCRLIEIILLYKNFFQDDIILKVVKLLPHHYQQLKSDLDELSLHNTNKMASEKINVIISY